MSDDSFIREVDEELRQDQFKSLWDRFGAYILGGAILVVLVTAAVIAYRYWDETRANAAGDAPGTLRRTSERHLGLEGGTGSSSSSSAIAGELRYRIPAQPSLDGNTVETDREHAAFMDNAIRYQASLNFLNGRIQGLKLALRGE